MNEGTRNQLDIKLKKMLNQLDQGEVKRKRPTLQSGIGNTIRRRKGQKDKRFSISLLSAPGIRDRKDDGK